MATKPGDHTVGFILVFLVLALIWWGGSTIRACFSGSSDTDGGVDGQAETAASSSAGTDPGPSPSIVPTATAAAEAGPARSAICQAMHDTTEKDVAAAKATWPCVTVPDVDALGCTTTAKSTWGFRVDAIKQIAPPLGADGCGEYGIQVNLVRTDAAGTETAEIPNLFLFRKDAGAGAEAGAFYKYNVSTGAVGITIPEAKIFDFDGDGESEVYVRTRIGTKDAEQQSEGSVVTWIGNKIAPYPGAADLAIDGIDDVDIDGRPDLLLRTWKTQIADDKGFSHPATTVRAVAHSLPDGTFSKKDAAAVAYLQKQCPAAPKLDGLAGGTLTDGDVIACALLWAVPAGKIDPLIAKAPPWTRDLAKEKPPLSLK
ncbi:hypothetical protein BH09MYX1_BH09MYX1_51490 [soil metagenome]